ncbi:MAG TPA: flagellar basal body L-ring protein FlgH [Rhizomicrobium sp.]|jgi:flagellar L-ring protein precursor FlgH
MMRSAAVLMVTLACAVPQAHATDLMPHGSWPGLASDRSSRAIGDILTVIIYENSQATNSAENVANKSSSFQGQISAGNPLVATNGLHESGGLSLAHTADNGATTSRAGTMVAELSVTVDQVFSNGDLHVTGSQALNINGEKTNIKVSGRVRLADISPSNAVLSTSLADAAIDYDGAGFVSASSQPGLMTRVLNWIDLP